VSDKEREKVMIDSYIHRRTYNCVCVCVCVYAHTYSTCNKASLLQAFTGTEGSRRLRLPDLKTIGT